jgi:hypothetical protein
VWITLIGVIATALSIKLVFDLTLYLLAPELQLCPDQVVRLRKQHRVDARRRGYG